LYPEGRDLCHAVVLHPPGGIAGGDLLRLNITAEVGAQVLITTPGAGKWYRSGGRPARQQVNIAVAAGGAVEWLPQETIFFDGADATLATHVELDSGATFLGLETLCLGRVAAGESFRQGRIGLRTRIERGGIPLWSERGLLTGGSPWLHAAAGLAGHPFCATLLAVGPDLDKAVLASCRGCTMPPGTHCGVTMLPGGVLVARCLGHDAEPVREWFLGLWAVLRPALLHRPAVTPRLWNT
jgi:urease accessory protein